MSETTAEDRASWIIRADDAGRAVRDLNGALARVAELETNELKLARGWEVDAKHLDARIAELEAEVARLIGQTQIGRIAELEAEVDLHEELAATWRIDLDLDETADIHALNTAFHARYARIAELEAERDHYAVENTRLTAYMVELEAEVARHRRGNVVAYEQLEKLEARIARIHRELFRKLVGREPKYEEEERWVARFTDDSTLSVGEAYAYRSEDHGRGKKP